ncbi:MAG TPA: family 1 encapsulin nanocompartment shell protein [Pseudonocardia sp.]|uniref:family 1 encapsulin nanocompartment shell protein n=1 Tax=Pseudonocardia sp. TaxID=60912 RepID=UPI002BB0371E|nr:family 1 encapsulin nanocompartment shell protein [Pseudonocardia sp.]HTF52379.1 family 1 encapsulin nanocompartment shell protein [Pseudonocardia sp.]
MNNLHRELAPISDAAWADIEAEARRTFTQYVAARRVVDVVGPSGDALSAVGTGHLRELEPPAKGVLARSRTVLPLVELRVPFVVSREAVDDVERGAKDSDWQPVKDAAQEIAFAEDRAVFDGFPAADITGIRAASSNAPIALPAEVRDYPDAVAQALTALRLAGVAGPYRLLLSADAYTEVAETTDHGYPIREHIARVIQGGDIIWAPAIDGAFLLSARGGDYELHLGQDLSIGYQSHSAHQIELYFQESFTFIVQTAEAGVPLTAG